MRSPPKPAGGEKVKNRVMSAYNQRRSSWASDVDSQIGIGQSPHPAPSPQALLHKALHHHSGGVTSPSVIGDPSQAFNSPAFAPNKPSFGGNNAKPRDGSVVVPQSYVDDLLSAAAARLASPPAAAAAAGQLGSTRGRAPPPAAVTISHSSSEGVTQASVSRVSTANPSPVHTSGNTTPSAAEERKVRRGWRENTVNRCSCGVRRSFDQQSHQLRNDRPTLRTCYCPSVHMYVIPSCPSFPILA